VDRARLGLGGPGLASTPSPDRPGPPGAILYAADLCNDNQPSTAWKRRRGPGPSGQ